MMNKMFSEFRLFGHPPHPILNHVPIGLLSVTVLFDLVGFFYESDVSWAVSYWIIVVALLAAIPTVATGFADYLIHVREPRLDRLALIHMIIMLSTLGVFVLSMVFRRAQIPPDAVSSYWAIGLDVVGTILLTIGGWFGGEMVYGEGVGLRVGRNQ